MKATPITPAGEDERGYTAEFAQERTGTHLIVFRKAGTVSGRHYHKGLSQTKDPEILILLSGTCTFSWKNINDNELITEKYTGPVKFEIPKLTWHEIVTDTDCTFMEQNSIAEHAADTFRL